jgi:hypothetical protein
MHSQTFRSDTETGTVVISYYPVVGTDNNTGPRYQQEAAITGFDVIGITRDGSNATSPDRHLHDSLSPEHFDEYCAEQATKLEKVTLDYDNVIFRGQSTGSFPTLGVVKSGLVRATHLLIEDGINLRLGPHGRTQRLLPGWYAWLSTQAQNAFSKSPLPSPDWLVPTKQSDSHKTAMFFMDVYHWSHLWRSSYSRDAFLHIAATQPKLPVLCKFIGHSVTSTAKLVAEFIPEVTKAHTARLTAQAPVADIRYNYHPDAWHNYIEYPQYGAANLLEVASMRSYV